MNLTSETRISNEHSAGVVEEGYARVGYLALVLDPVRAVLACAAVVKGGIRNGRDEQGTESGWAHRASSRALRWSSMVRWNTG